MPATKGVDGLRMCQAEALGNLRRSYELVRIDPPASHSEIVSRTAVVGCYADYGPSQKRWWPRRCGNTPGPGRNLMGGPDMSEPTSPVPALERPDLGRRTTLTITEAAELLGIGRSAAYEAARRGELPTRRLGRRLLVPVPALLRWLDAADADAHPAA